MVYSFAYKLRAKMKENLYVFLKIFLKYLKRRHDMISIKLAATVCVLTLFFACVSDSGQKKEEIYSANVIGKGIDCGGTYLIQFTEKIDKVYNRLGLDTSRVYSGNVFYADLLPVQFQKEYTNIRIEFRPQTTNESYSCTTLGQSYPHIVITSATQ
jgi:hypothetical protein